MAASTWFWLPDRRVGAGGSIGNGGPPQSGSLEGRCRKRISIIAAPAASDAADARYVGNRTALGVKVTPENAAYLFALGHTTCAEMTDFGCARAALLNGSAYWAGRLCGTAGTTLGFERYGAGRSGRQRPARRVPRVLAGIQGDHVGIKEPSLDLDHSREGARGYAGVACCDCEPAAGCLSDDHAVERILVVPVELAGKYGVG